MADIRYQKGTHWFRILWSSILFGIPSALFLGVTVLLANFCMMLTLIIYPISPTLFYRTNAMIAGIWWSEMVYLIKFVWPTKVVYTGDTPEYRRRAFIFANHQEMPDIPGILLIAHRCHMLGNLKFFVKKALRYVPGVGWGMWFLNFLFVKRAWTEDKEFVTNMFNRLSETGLPYWIVSFPEGTRIKPRKLEQSQRFAKKAGHRPSGHVLFPRTRGFRECMDNLDGEIEGVFDITLGYPAGIPRLWQLICGLVPEIHIDVKYYPTGSLPKTSLERSAWMIHKFEEKDQRMAEFLQTGTFVPNTSES